MYLDRETISHAVEVGRLMARDELSKEAGLFSSIGRVLKRPVKTVEKRVLRGSAGKVVERSAAKAGRTMNTARTFTHPELRVHPVSANPMGPRSLRGANLGHSGPSVARRPSVARGPASAGPPPASGGLGPNTHPPRSTMPYAPVARGPVSNQIPAHAPVSSGSASPGFTPWYENPAYVGGKEPKTHRPKRDVAAHTPAQKPEPKVAPGPNSASDKYIKGHEVKKTKSNVQYEKPQDTPLNKADGGVTDVAGNGEVVDEATQKRKGILPFLWRNRLPIAGLGVAGVGYGAYKALPWAGRQLEATSTIPLASSGGYGPVAYGYGTSPYGNGTPNMGYGG